MWMRLLVLCVVALACVADARAVRGKAKVSCRDPVCLYFRLMDLDHDGRLSRSELIQHFNAVDEGMGDKAAATGQLDDVIAAYDNDSDGLWSEAELRAATPTLPGGDLDGTDPQQIHVSFVDNPDEPSSLAASIMWVTGKPTATSTFRYGLSADDLSETLTGSTHTYTEGGWKGVIHQVHFTSWKPSVRYYYQVGDAVGNFSETYNFVAPPVAGTMPSAPHVFGVFGDMGTAIPWGYRVCEQMESDHKTQPFNALLHIGDIAYASTAMTAEVGEGGDGEIEAIWDIWARQVQPLAAYIPYVAGVGNHEKFWNYSSYLARFNNPAPWGGSPHQPDEAVFWFSFDYGLVHFTMMSTEHDYSPGSPQYEWLQNDLAKASANRAAVPWLVLTGHRPMYSSDVDEQYSHWPGCSFQKQIEPLMQQYGVDLYFAGHMHMYERIHPVLNGTVHGSGNVYTNPGAPVHVVQGTGGIFEDYKFVKPAPAWSANRQGKIGYGRMIVHNATHIFYEFLYVEGSRREDSFWLIKE